jgi:O-antigen ligase
LIFIPDAIDHRSPAWQGFAAHKNVLGQVAMVSVIIWYYSSANSFVRNRIFNILLLLLSVVILIGSKSITPILVLFLLLNLQVILYVKKSSSPAIGTGIIISLFGIIASFCFVPNFIEFILSLFGKNLTFTDRTDLWAIVFDEAIKRPFLGHGFGSFWVMDSELVENIVAKTYWIPNQAHSGYLDIFAETGIIGFFLFTLVVIAYFRKLLVFKISTFWKWIFISTLFLNLMESTLLKPNSLTGVLFIFSYLTLNFEAMKRKNKQKYADNLF